MTTPSAPIPANDAERVNALHELQILDSLPEQVYDDLALLAANICDTPIALVSLVDADRQWFKAKLGLTESETHRDLAFCSYAILEPESVLSIPDTLVDPRFATNELVTGGPQIRAYAGAPIVMESGAVLGTVCVVDTAPRTLTPEQTAALQALARQAATQLELRRLNLHLEETVAARTEDLQTALDAAQAADRAKSAFVSAMSHEIRTPMNGVIGMIDLLEQSSLGNPEKKIVSMARGAAQGLLRVVDNVLDFSKIEAGGMSIDQDPMSLESVTRQACDTLAALAENKGVKLELDIDPRLPQRVLGDSLRVGQVLLNLIANGIKFSSGTGRAGHVGVRVGLVEPGVDRCRVDLVVTDNGIGIDSAAQARLFSPFTQADAGTTKRFGGTGLGLHIASRLARLMGGDISVSSQPGAGARFTLSLPFICIQDAAAPNQERSGKEGPSILVADDNEMNQEVLRMQLGLFGFAADVVDNGLAALEKVESGAYDLLLTDLHMPGMDGWELATRIRSKEPPGSRLPIVALTADASVGVAARCRQAGMDDCMFKPLPLAGLHAVLTAWLPADGKPPPLKKDEVVPPVGGAP